MPASGRDQEPIPRQRRCAHLRLKSRLKGIQAEIGHEAFGIDGVELQLCLPHSRVDGAVLLVSNISRGRRTAKIL